MSEDEGINLGELPEIPDKATTADVPDAFQENVAFKFAFAGVGQAGGRIAATFSELGYGRVCAINTTVQDLADLKLPSDRKLDIGAATGAAKDPEAARAAVADKAHDFHDLFRRSWGDSVDHVFVCLAAGGGTGAGAFTKVAEAARAYMEEHRRPAKVGAIVALPKDKDGQQMAKNTIYTLRRLAEAGLSPVIFIDNQKIGSLFSPTVSQEHLTENQATARLLHAFNKLAGSDSQHSTFDRAELARMLESGVIAFATANATSWANASDITTPIRDRLKNNVLASCDLSKGRIAALVFIPAGDAYDQVKADDLDHGTQMMTRLLATGAIVFTGVYKGQGSGIRILAMVGGLPWPKERLEELAKIAGADRDEIAKFLGV